MTIELCYSALLSADCSIVRFKLWRGLGGSFCVVGIVSAVTVVTVAVVEEGVSTWEPVSWVATATGQENCVCVCVCVWGGGGGGLGKQTMNKIALSKLITLRL